MFIIIKIFFASLLEVQLFESNLYIKFLKKGRKIQPCLSKNTPVLYKTFIEKNASSPKHYSFLKDIWLP